MGLRLVAINSKMEYSRRKFIRAKKYANTLVERGYKNDQHLESQ